MTNVTCVAVEHKHGHVRVGVVSPRAPDVKGRELLAIVGGDDELFVVAEVVLARPGDVSAGVGGDGGRVD